MKIKKLLTFLLVTVICSFGAAGLLNSSSNMSGSGKASYYGKRFHGRLTASGEKFDMYAMTAAHKTLEFGTKVKVINKKNGKSVIVEINDRGPFVKSRDFDLSKEAFKAIANINRGVINIDYQVVN